jgi:hypothetical protein
MVQRVLVPRGCMQNRVCRTVSCKDTYTFIVYKLEFTERWSSLERVCRHEKVGRFITTLTVYLIVCVWQGDGWGRLHNLTCPMLVASCHNIKVSNHLIALDHFPQSLKWTVNTLKSYSGDTISVLLSLNFSAPYFTGSTGKCPRWGSSPIFDISFPSQACSLAFPQSSERPQPPLFSAPGNLSLRLNPLKGWIRFMSYERFAVLKMKRIQTLPSQTTSPHPCMSSANLKPQSFNFLDV